MCENTDFFQLNSGHFQTLVFVYGAPDDTAVFFGPRRGLGRSQPTLHVLKEITIHIKIAARQKGCTPIQVLVQPTTKMYFITFFVPYKRAGTHFSIHPAKRQYTPPSKKKPEKLRKPKLI